MLVMPRMLMCRHLWALETLAQQRCACWVLCGGCARLSDCLFARLIFMLLNLQGQPDSRDRR